MGWTRSLRRAASVLSICVLPVLLAAGAAAEEPVADSVASIRECVRKGEFAKAVPLVAAISGTDDARARELFRDLTSCRDDALACAAYSAVGKQKDKSLLATMRQRAVDKDLSKDRPGVYLALLDTFVALADDSKSTRDTLEEVVRRHLPLQADFAIRAIRAYSTVRNRDTIDRLIDWLAEAESTVGPSGNRVSPVSAETRAAHDKEHPVIRECLRSLTGVDHENATAWKAWWKDKRANFKCPPPERPKE